MLSWHHTQLLTRHLNIYMVAERSSSKLQAHRSHRSTKDLAPERAHMSVMKIRKSASLSFILSLRRREQFTLSSWQHSKGVILRRVACWLHLQCKIRCVLRDTWELEIRVARSWSRVRYFPDSTGSRTTNGALGKHAPWCHSLAVALLEKAFESMDVTAENTHTSCSRMTEVVWTRQVQSELECWHFPEKPHGTPSVAWFSLWSLCPTWIKLRDCSMNLVPGVVWNSLVHNQKKKKEQVQWWRTPTPGTAVERRLEELFVRTAQRVVPSRHRS